MIENKHAADIFTQQTIASRSVHAQREANRIAKKANKIAMIAAIAAILAAAAAVIGYRVTS